MEIEKDNVIYAVTIKSGPNWGNSRQIDKMKKDFGTAKRILGTNTGKKNIVAVNGCCYGKEPVPDRGEYLKFCGQEFWTFMSGDRNLYTGIIEPIGHKAKERNDEFSVEYGKVINRFTKDFLESFCKDDGTILWDKIVRFNSADKEEPRAAD